MQISSISNFATSTAGLAQPSPQSQPATPSHSTTAPQANFADSDIRSAATGTSASAQATQQTASATPGKSSVHANSGSSAAPVQSSARSLAADTLAGYYSSTLDGKSYAGSVEESDGTYTASVMTVPEAVATGSSIESADTNLTAVIDALA